MFEEIADLQGLEVTGGFLAVSAGVSPVRMLLMLLVQRRAVGIRVRPGWHVEAEGLSDLAHAAE